MTLEEIQQILGQVAQQQQTFQAQLDQQQSQQRQAGQLKPTASLSIEASLPAHRGAGFFMA
ncbi:MAG: hypothetical protein ONB55_22565 [candidate division KSB1 bacterium]|nr:hypothetical protein [candidate division KSB1 bacterium]